MRTCGTSCHKNSFLHKIYMAFCPTTLNIVTVACSFHYLIIPGTFIFLSQDHPFFNSLLPFVFQCLKVGCYVYNSKLLIIYFLCTKGWIEILFARVFKADHRSAIKRC